MKKSAKIMLGLLLLWPLVLYPGFLVSSALYAELLGGAVSPSGLDRLLGSIVPPLNSLTLAWGVAIFVVYSVHLTRNPRLDRRRKRRWMVGFVSLPIVSLAFYWYVQVWRAPDLPANRCNSP
jgi:hypothetical protein